MDSSATNTFVECICFQILVISKSLFELHYITFFFLENIMSGHHQCSVSLYEWNTVKIYYECVIYRIEAIRAPSKSKEGLHFMFKTASAFQGIDYKNMQKHSV